MEVLKPLIRNLARSVGQLERGCDARPPARVVHRGDGSYLLRAYRLDSTADAQPLIAIQIEHQVPLMVRLYRAGRVQRLPPREQQMVPLLLEGKPVSAIGAALHITPNTVGGYLHNLYVRLGISRREELLPALLSTPQNTQ